MAKPLCKKITKDIIINIIKSDVIIILKIKELFSLKIISTISKINISKTPDLEPDKNIVELIKMK